MSTPPPTPLRIAIIGAGPGGLTLARILLLHPALEHQQSQAAAAHPIEITIYERDPSRTTPGRTMGGSLDLHAETGLRAMRAARLMSEFRREASRMGGDRRRIYDARGRLRVDMDPPPSPPPVEEGEGDEGEDDGEVKGRPEIDRNDLRSILIDSLPPSTIKWNHRLVSISSPSSPSHPAFPEGLPKYTLTFSSAPTHTTVANLIIDSSGSSSLIRTLLSPSPSAGKPGPTYSSLTSFDLTIPSSTLTSPTSPYAHLAGDEIDKNALTFFSGGGMRKSVITQWNKGGRIRVNCNVWEGDEGWLDRFILDSNAANVGGDEKEKGKGLKDKIVDLFEGFDERIRDYIRAGDESNILSRKVHSLPLTSYHIPPSSAETYPGVTLLGDAAHLMSPFAGMGVNLAMADAADLAVSLGGWISGISSFSSSSALASASSKPEADGGKANNANKNKTLQEVLRTYEKGMFERAKEFGAISARNLEMYHREDAIEVMMEMFGGASGSPGAGGAKSKGCSRERLEGE